MNKNTPETKEGFKKRLASFKYAFTGILELIKSEPNIRIHLVATIITIAISFILKISDLEWCVVLILIGMVWSTEALNTVVEKLVDHLFPTYHETARICKDIAAGAVLITAIIAATCAAIIFIPKILTLLQ